MSDQQSRAMQMYMRRMFRVIMILAPFFCLVAGILFSTYKALGFYPDVPLSLLIVFDCTCVLYCIIGAYLSLGCIDENDELKPRYFSFGKWFVPISLLIQWNFISYLFPVAEFWLFLPFFLIATVAFLDHRTVAGFSIALLVCTFISWAVRPEVFLPASQTYFVPDLILRIFGLVFITLALSIITYIVRRICVTDVTNELVGEVEQETRVDAMTRLNNLRAFYAVFDAIEDPMHLGVVYADVNGLKHANDNYGHAAGDKLIVDFARVLANHFRGRETFRIGGDEFVVLCQNIGPEPFGQRISELLAELHTQEIPIASVGSAYGRATCEEALRAAEERMYEQKAVNYEKHPDLKR